MVYFYNFSSFYLDGGPVYYWVLDAANNTANIEYTELLGDKLLKEPTNIWFPFYKSLSWV